LYFKFSISILIFYNFETSDLEPVGLGGAGKNVSGAREGKLSVLLFLDEGDTTFGNENFERASGVGEGVGNLLFMGVGNLLFLGVGNLLFMGVGNLLFLGVGVLLFLGVGNLLFLGVGNL